MAMLSKTELKENLLNHVARIVFTKKDGSLREMHCTLMKDFIPAAAPIDENVKHVPRKNNDDVLAVWDMDNKGWRSFRLDSITEVQYIGVNRV